MLIEIAAGILTLIVLALMWLRSKLPNVTNYTAELAKHNAWFDQENDFDKDVKELQAKRDKDYLELTENYYNLTTDLFHIIWGPHYSMGNPFPREFGKWQDYPASQQMYQCYLGHSLGVREGQTIGDFGCGTGGPTRCIAQFTGAKIKAVNITRYHLKQAEKWNKEFGLEDRIELIRSDFHATPLEDESLDGVYMCESLGHSPDYTKLSKEVFRVLKPGAKFTGYNWDLREEFDETNAHHRKIRFMLCYGLAMPRMRKMSEFGASMKEAGFEVICQRDHSDFAESLGGKPWWAVIEDMKSVQGILSTATSLVYYGLKTLELLMLISPGTAKMYDNLMICLKVGMEEGYKERVFTPMAYWLAVKPEKK